LPFVTVDNIRLFYRLEGAADRPVLVLSHSIGTDMGLWEPQVEALLPHFQILRYDTRGHGASDAPGGEYTVERLSLDLIGLPPTAEEAAAFESDHSADALAKVIDRLLASPHYGERWGRHWLDVARYADTKGYVFTEERKYPYSYTYRDYVIRAFNNDLPFDRFILEQLAADQLTSGDDKAALAAMGFLTLGRRFGNNQNDIIDDRIDVVTRGLLGLTATCARCHDHKYDPIPTDDYYSLYGIFASSVEPSDLPQIAQPELTEAYRAYEQELAQREGAVQTFVSEKLAALSDELRSHAADYLVAAVRKSGQELPEGIGLSLGPGDVRPELVNRWKAYLDETAKQPHPVFGPWHELGRLPAEGFAPAAAKIIAGLNDAPEATPRTNSLVKKGLETSPPLPRNSASPRLRHSRRKGWTRAAGSTAKFATPGRPMPAHATSPAAPPGWARAPTATACSPRLRSSSAASRFRWICARGRRN
jgi:hypothetical protein